MESISLGLLETDRVTRATHSELRDARAILLLDWIQGHRMIWNVASAILVIPLILWQSWLREAYPGMAEAVIGWGAVLTLGLIFLLMSDNFWDVFGRAIMFLGAASNAFVILANGGYMPAAMPPRDCYILWGRFAYLGDYQWYCCSVGDYVLFIGVVVSIVGGAVYRVAKRGHRSGV
jgi:hypothetical protein